MTDFVVALTTLPADVDAESLARALVESRVAACVHVSAPVQSVYAWQGAVHADVERQLVIKTSRARLDALWSVLRDRHPYDTPEFVVLPIDTGNPDYLSWMTEVLGP